MKHTVTITLALLAALFVKAQDITEIPLTINDMPVPAACKLSLEKDESLVKDALKQRLSDLKTKKDNGYTVAYDQTVRELASSPITIYTKVEEQGRRKNRTTEVTLAATSTDANVIASLQANIKSWLADFVKYVDRYEAQQQLAKEEEILKKKEKIHKSAVSDVAAIEKTINSKSEKIESKKKDIEKYNSKIADAENDIKELQSDIEKQGKKLEESKKALEEAQKDLDEAKSTVEKYRKLVQ